MSCLPDICSKGPSKGDMVEQSPDIKAIKTKKGTTHCQVNFHTNQSIARGHILTELGNGLLLNIDL